MTFPAPAPPTDDRPTARPRRRLLPTFDLSATQLVATALAAVTATFLASYLGVSGTIIGAAVASVATAVGNAVYGKSLRSTRDRVREVVPVRLARTDPASPTVVAPVDRTSTADIGRSEPGRGAEDEPPTLPSPAAAAQAVRTAPWRHVLLVATAVFAAVLAIVTSVEVLAGRPVTDLVRGEAGSGTTLFGADTANEAPATPTPTVTVTVTPSVVITTPVVTQTAPPVTRTATPTKTVTSGTGTATTTPSGPGTATTGTSGPSRTASP